MSEFALLDQENDEAGKAVSLSYCDLRDPTGRESFLRQFCAIGEPALFQAVTYIWTCLNEPKELRCILMGLAAQTGGQGKCALVHLLRACLNEILVVGHPLPAPSEFASLDAWHLACMAAFRAEEDRETSVYERYSEILNGGIPITIGKGPELIQGPWLDHRCPTEITGPNPMPIDDLDPPRWVTSSTNEPQ